MVQDNDKLSYASITIGSHGFYIRMNTQATFLAEVSCMGIELLHTKGNIPSGQNILIQPNEMEMMVMDNRRGMDGGSFQSFVFVFKAYKTEEEVLKLIHPQLKMWMGRFKRLHETLLKNTNEMLTVLEEGMVQEYICPIEKEKE